MMSSTSVRKRKLSELVEDEQASQPPKTRQKLDNDVNQDSNRTESPDAKRSFDSDNSATSDHSKAKDSAFLPYPDLSNSRTRSIPFQQPSQIISFSYDASHVQEFNNSALRYFVDPPSGAKLSYGYERWIKRPEERGRIDSLLKAISKVNRDAENRGYTFPEIGVVSWRGVMTKILTAPHEDRDGWELNIMSLNGTLYLEEHLTEERLNEKNNPQPRQRTQTYYGYAFESYCTSELPPGSHSSNVTLPSSTVPRGWGGDVNTNIQWCSVVRTKLGDTRMILGGEVDCVRGKYTSQTDTFVELKTSLAIRGQQDEARFEKKLLKFYFQSFLLGVPEIVVGFRTPGGILTTVQKFKTVQIPRLVRGKSGGWDPLVCLEFGHRFLGFLKSIVQKDVERPQPNRVWRVKFVPGSGLTVVELEPADVEEVVNGEDRVGFLPRWYWDEIQQTDSVNRDFAPVATASNRTGWRI